MAPDNIERLKASA